MTTFSVMKKQKEKKTERNEFIKKISNWGVEDEF